MQPPKPKLAPNPVPLPRPSLPKSLPPPPPPTPVPPSGLVYARAASTPPSVPPPAPVAFAAPEVPVPPAPVAFAAPEVPVPPAPAAFVAPAAFAQVPSEEPSGPGELVAEADLIMEEFAPPLPIAPAAPRSKPWISRTAQGLSERYGKVTLAVWLVTGTLGLSVVLQRNGVFRSAAELVGKEGAYRAFETETLGGPGAGTVGSVELLWRKNVPEAAFPFSEVERRVSGASPEKER